MLVIDYNLYVNVKFVSLIFLRKEMWKQTIQLDINYLAA